MKVYSTTDIRNVALLGHGDSGKTSLTSYLLHTSGPASRLGKVDEGTTTTDFDEEEIERKISLQTALAHLEWRHKKVNLLDTPGYTAFVADAKAAISVGDGVILVVDGVAGVEVITRRVFRHAAERSLPVLFVVNKLDRERASFERALGSIHDRFGRAAVALQIPIGQEDGFIGAVDLLSMKAQRYEKDGDGKYKEEDVPADLVEQAQTARTALVEMIAETDDELMEAFFESGDLTADQLRSGLRKAVLKRKIFPVLTCSAGHGIGIQSLLDNMVELLPDPAELGPWNGQNPEDKSEISREVSASETLSLFVYKTVADPFAGRLSLFRVCSGVLKGDSAVVNVRTDHNERMANASLLQGKKLEPIPEIHAGDLGVIAKLKETQTSDTLADPSNRIEYPKINFPAPAISYAVKPKSKGDEEKITSALHRLIEEDPVLRVRRDPQTHELLVSGTGQIHVEVAVAKMKKKFGVEAILHPPKVPYFETIRARKSEAVQGRHKKQTGGHGQFGDCKIIEIEPLAQRRQDSSSRTRSSEGAIPQNYRPAVEKGIQRIERLKGYGWPVIRWWTSEWCSTMALTTPWTLPKWPSRSRVLSPSKRRMEQAKPHPARTHHGRLRGSTPLKNTWVTSWAISPRDAANPRVWRPTATTRSFALRFRWPKC